MIVWKYVLGRGTRQWVVMPTGSKVLSAQLRGDEICAWVLVDPDAPKVAYEFVLVDTGEPLGGWSYRHVATILLDHGVRVVHVFVGGGA